MSIGVTLVELLGLSLVAPACGTLATQQPMDAAPEASQASTQDGAAPSVTYCDTYAGPISPAQAAATPEAGRENLTTCAPGSACVLFTPTAIYCGSGTPYKCPVSYYCADAGL